MIGKIVQNYKIISLIGEGGMGSVYKALDFKLDRYVAIKVLKKIESQNTHFVERFKREAKNQAKLSHPNIVSVYGFVEARDFLGFVMEYVEGRTVEDYLLQYGRLSINDSLQIIKQVLSGISYAHDEGFIHRDIKPSNIIIDTKGVIKITDFGIAKSVNESMSITKSGAKVGTVLYMSPEQIKGFEPTIKSDLYSISVSLYEMIGGRVPFDFNSEYEILDAHLNSIPAPLSDIFPEVPVEIDEIILRGMNKSVSGNFNNSDEFIFQLEQIEYSSPLYKQKSGNIQDRIELSSPSVKTTTGRRVFNLFLFFIFIGLVIVAFKAVTDYFIQYEKLELAKQNEEKLNSGPFTNIKSDWQKVTIGTNENINSISIQNKTIIVAGNNGIIVRSSDAGQSWQKIQTNFKQNLYDISFIGINSLIAVGEKGLVIKSNDGGLTWRRQTSNTTESLFTLHVNREIVKAAGANGIILNSLNSGKDWNLLAKPSNEIIYDIYFTNAAEGYIAGWNGLMMFTGDGGRNWSVIQKLTDNYLRSILFINSRIALIAGGGGTIIRSEDGGKSWTNLSTSTISSFTKLYSYNNDICIALTTKGEIFRSSDTGLTWELVNSGVFVQLSDITNSADGSVYITGGNGTLLKSNIN